MIRAPPLKVEVTVNAPETANGVVEGAVAGRAEVLLDVPRLKVVKDVGDFQSTEELDVVAVEFEVEGILDLGVDADEGGESTGFVACANVVPIDANVRIREAGVNINDGYELEALGELDNAPEEDAVGGVVRQRSVLIGADERIRNVAKELIVVVEFTVGP